MAINPQVREQIRMDLMNAPHGHKAETIRRWAIIVGLKPQTVYSALELNARTRKSEPVRPELRDWAKIVAQVKKRPPTEAGEISTDQAVRIAIESKLLPVSAMDVSIGTFDRIMRELGTNKKSVRCNRIQADRPNKAHHFDGSSSNHFYIANKVGSEYVMKMHRPGAGGYKNKPIPVDRLRPYYYGLIDDHSGRAIARVTAAMNENAADSALFLSWAWAEMGLPDELHMDQGMLKKCFATRDFIDRLNIGLPEYTPFNSRAHGKIERTWRTTWQRFEKQFFAMDDWQKFEIPMTEFNARLLGFLEELNAQPHRYEKTVTRMDAWRRVMLNGGIITLPADAISTIARREKRKVDIAGMFEYRGTPYEVKGLHDAWVYVYEGVFEDKLVVEDIVTRERFEVRNFKPLNIGEFRGHVETAHQRAVKDGAELNIPEAATLYSGRGDAETRGRGENVISLPIRTTEREVASVFDVEHYASLEDAMAEFTAIVGTFLSDQDRQAIEGLIEENKLDKAYVANLAQEIRGELEARRAIAL
ncbi:MAG: hypothetical protein AABZ15_11645 [Nitrospirota bacterium]